VGFREVGFQDELAAAAERVESEQGPPSREVMEKDQRERVEERVGSGAASRRGDDGGSEHRTEEDHGPSSMADEALQRSLRTLHNKDQIQEAAIQEATRILQGRMRQQMQGSAAVRNLQKKNATFDCFQILHR
jgi:hypothetical protein